MTKTMETLIDIAKRKGLNANSIANNSDIPKSTLYQWFYGNNEPSVYNMEKLAGVLGLEITFKEVSK